MRPEEVAGLRERFAALASVDVDTLQPLKISRYDEGQHFAQHCDAVDGAGQVDEESDYYADAARVSRGTRSCPFPGANRFITVFCYLNSVARGGRTRWRWIGSVPDFYTTPGPAPMCCTALAAVPDQVSIRPERGMAVIHFPSVVPSAGGYTDRNASHESETAEDEKWVCQQFIWSHAPPGGFQLAGTEVPERPLSDVRL